MCVYLPVSIYVSVYVYVCQSPQLHPLLRLVSQLNTRRERGLTMHVCTTHICSPQPLTDKTKRNTLFFDCKMQSVAQTVIKSCVVYYPPTLCDSNYAKLLLKRIYLDISRATGWYRKSWWIDDDNCSRHDESTSTFVRLLQMFIVKCVCSIL